MTIAEPATGTGVSVDLKAALEPLLARATDRATDTLLSVSRPVAAVDPIALHGAARGLGASLWMQPSEAMALVGIGEAWGARPGGVSRFTAISQAWSTLLSTALVDDDGAVLPAERDLLVGRRGHDCRWCGDLGSGGLCPRGLGPGEAPDVSDDAADLVIGQRLVGHREPAVFLEHRYSIGIPRLHEVLGMLNEVDDPLLAEVASTLDCHGIGNRIGKAAAIKIGYGICW